MTEKEREVAFVKQVKSTLNESDERLDASTLSRLAQVRNQALGGYNARRTRFLVRYKTPVIGLITTTAVLLVVTSLLLKAPVSVQSYGDPADVEILASAEQLDFFEELDFYSWLTRDEEYAG